MLKTKAFWWGVCLGLALTLPAAGYLVVVNAAKVAVERASAERLLASLEKDVQDQLDLAVGGLSKKDPMAEARRLMAEAQRQVIQDARHWFEAGDITLLIRLADGSLAAARSERLGHQRVQETTGIMLDAYETANKKCEEEYAQLAAAMQAQRAAVQRGQIPAELLKRILAFFL